MKFLSAILLLPSLVGAEKKVRVVEKVKVVEQTPTEPMQESSSSDDKQLILKVTNLSYRQPFSPFFVMVHNYHVDPILTFGEPASPELQNLAENGNPADLVAKYSWVDGVCSAFGTEFGLTGGDPDFPPSNEIMVTVTDDCPLVTIAAMAVNTNDALVVVNGEEFYPYKVVTVPGLDAGTEENNELCTSIPGPGCGGNNTADGMGEGVVHVHRGLFGIGDLEQSVYDWRNPMMQVEASEGHY